MDRLQAVEELEIDLLLEGVFQLFGYDFRGYQREPLRAKLHHLMQGDGLKTVSALLEKVMHDETASDAFLRALSVHPAGLFEEPEHYLALRGVVGPWLRSCPSSKVWIAECASVQEAATVAILLEEEQLYDKTRIFATMSNESLLKDAARGSFTLDQFGVYEDNYRRGGGTKSLADYCVEDDGKMYFRRELLSRITWAQYNLATDASFNEFELIVCRRALGDFGPALRRRALQLFRESLPLFGMLSVDHTNEPDDAPFVAYFKTVSAEEGLYRRIA